MSESREGGKLPLKSALKRNTRQQQQQQQHQQQQHQTRSAKPFQVPEGLRSLLNEITKEVKTVKSFYEDAKIILVQFLVESLNNEWSLVEGLMEEKDIKNVVQFRYNLFSTSK